MKKLVLLFAMLGLSANAFAETAAGEAAVVTKEAVKAGEEIVKPTAPRVAAPRGSTVTGQTVINTSGKTISTKGNLFDIHTKPTGTAAGTSRELLERSTNCMANGVFKALPSVLKNSVQTAVEAGLVNSKNSCLPEFDDATTSVRAASIIDAMIRTVGSNVRTANTDVIAKGLVESAKALSAQTGEEVRESLYTLVQICRVKDDAGNPKECIFNSSVCNSTVISKAQGLL